MTRRTNAAWLACEVAGCSGVRLASGVLCLAHASTTDRSAALDEVHRTGVLDVRGTEISDEILDQILGAMPRAVNGKALFRSSRFDGSAFTGAANFDRATFQSGTMFKGAVFNGGAVFIRSTFAGGVVFSESTFSQPGKFGGAAFTGNSNFDRASFAKGAEFAGATFSDDATFAKINIAGGGAYFAGATFSRAVLFVDATFTGTARFNQAVFIGHARFDRAIFKENTNFNDARFSDNVEFNGATFDGHSRFDRVTFEENARFDHATFAKSARFDQAKFLGGSRFDQTSFADSARFELASFAKWTRFDVVTFSDEARFDQVTFQGHTRFSRANFIQRAGFDEVTFNGRTRFDLANFSQDAKFNKTTFRHLAVFADAKFDQARQFGPILANRGIVLDGVAFAQSVRIEISTIGICCREARFPGGVQFRLRWARVVLDGADFPAPSTLAGIPSLSSEELVAQEGRIAKSWKRILSEELSEQPQLISLRRANVAGLGLSNIMVNDCRFASAHNLDMMRFESDVRFSSTPASRGTARKVRRQVIAEEQDWRAQQSGQKIWQNSFWPDWLGERPAVLDAGQIADRYRALRKGREDDKNEPGAADFYYGEMEMRRHANTTPAAERSILWLYWLVSGYGLRALRSLTGLFILGAFVTVMLTGWGLAADAPVTTPTQQLSGTIFASHNMIHINAKLDDIPTALPPAAQRWTGTRVETSLEVTFESFVFRSADQPLTTEGTWITIAARILGPIMLAFTLLSIRNRVKR